MQLPLVSCLCLTKGRAPLLKRAIQCFLNQTYPEKEMVLVFPADDYETLAMILSFNDRRLVCHTYDLGNNFSIGELRNFSIEKSTGEYFCQWDDDDWSHPERVEIQLNTALRARKEASVLVYWIMFDSGANTAYMSYPTPWPPTILCKKSLYERYHYPAWSLHEDAKFLLHLLSGNHLAPVSAPLLYIYVYHRRNTCSGDHFKKLFKSSSPLSFKASIMIADVLRGNHSAAKATAILDSPEVLGSADYFEHIPYATPVGPDEVANDQQVRASR